MQQDLAAVLRQGIDVDVLAGPPGVGAAPGLAEAEPVGGPVADATETFRIHERLNQDWPGTVAALPVLRQLLGGQRQRVRGQIVDPHPRKQQEAGLTHHQVQMLLVGALGPADPVVAAGQRARRLAEQQAAQRALVPVAQEVAQLRAQRLAVAQVVIVVDVFVEQPGLLRTLRQLQAQRSQLPQAVLDGRLRVRAGRSA